MLDTIISWGTFCAAFALQVKYFIGTVRKLDAVGSFFTKKADYQVLGSREDSCIDPEVAQVGTPLNWLIHELNEYTVKNHGTTDFGVMQNKTERKIKMLYDNATARIAFPTYIGLMGTFVGVFIGLCFFIRGMNTAGGVTDSSIKSLIGGVLVSMSTSFFGLFLTTVTHHKAANVQRKIREDKNEFYEFIQNELMPTLGVSMVAALNKLHHTINLFEPSFNRVIDRFQHTFESCTERFGNAFENNLNTVSNAVSVMGANMEEINRNVSLQAKLLKTLQSKGVAESLDAFVRASQAFEHVTRAIEQFDQIRMRMQATAIELCEAQQHFNESLEMPADLVDKLNVILSRFTTFEDNLNQFAETVQQTGVLSASQIKAFEDVLRKIERQNTLVTLVADTAESDITGMFEKQVQSLKELSEGYQRNFVEFAEAFQSSLQRLEQEMTSRREAFLATLEEQFSMEAIQKEFSQLGKLERIEALLDGISRRAPRGDSERVLDATRREVESIRTLLADKLGKPRAASAPKAPKKKGFFSKMFGGKKSK